MNNFNLFTNTNYNNLDRPTNYQSNNYINNNFNPISNINSNIQNNEIESMNKINDTTTSNYFNHFISKPNIINNNYDLNNNLELLDETDSLIDKLKNNLISANSDTIKLINNPNINYFDHNQNKIYQNKIYQKDENKNYQIDENLNKNENKNYQKDENLNKNEINSSQIVQPYIDWDKHEKPNLYYNNLVKDGKTEIMTEYIVNIDSIDRDIETYKNPFNYKVYFKSYQNQQGAVINRNFKNIKYIDLESIILPRKFYIDKKSLDITTIDSNIINIFSLNNKSGDIFQLSDLKDYVIIDFYIENDIKTLIYMLKPLTSNITMDSCWEISYNNNYISYFYYSLNNYSLEQDKFLLLYIDEINETNKLSSNNQIEKAFSILYPDFTNGDYYYLETRFIEKTYRFSNLGNLDSLNIKICNSSGNLININNDSIDKNVKTSNSCYCFNQLTKTYEKKYNCVCSYIRHPYYLKLQNNILFKIGVIETDIDKRVFN